MNLETIYENPQTNMGSSNTCALLEILEQKQISQGIIKNITI